MIECGFIIFSKLGELAIKGRHFFAPSSFKLEIRLISTLLSVTNVGVNLLLPPLLPVLKNICLKITRVIKFQLKISEGQILVIYNELIRLRVILNGQLISFFWLRRILSDALIV